MSFLKDDSFIDNDNAMANLGDNIQSLAMDSIYDQLSIDKNDICYIKRDFAKEYHGEQINVALYTEFTKERVERRLNVSDKIQIKSIISAVFNDDFNTCASVYAPLYNTLKKLEPIGARDETSRNELINHGIEAYLSGCFTVCFKKREKTPHNGRVFFVDAPEELEPLSQVNSEKTVNTFLTQHRI